MWKFSQLSAKNFLENITQNKELKCLLFASTAFYVVGLYPARLTSKRPPYPQENGERGVIHVLIYPQN
ncbi:unnamed protein product [Rhizophagus irregularis]|uniref:Uncharacterized protein n=1 Tax=Rhizophagus irregularis TaxID=588596 RepID=A0A915YNZ2_9GLOM|nr:unnamed protein product [Rhizophagus irregularis]CAB5296512.1 unnamed protein product [Rhizophagus irregularis]